jgi:hypothetical protein
MPRHAARSEVRVTGIASWEGRQDHGQYVSWVTDVHVHKANVSKLMRGGRARGQSAHEPRQTRKQHGDTCDHTAGHGEPHLAVVWATLRLRAFLVAQTPPRCCAWLRAVGAP